MKKTQPIVIDKDRNSIRFDRPVDKKLALYLDELLATEYDFPKNVCNEYRGLRLNRGEGFPGHYCVTAAGKKYHLLLALQADEKRLRMVRNLAQYLNRSDIATPIACPGASGLLAPICSFEKGTYYCILSPFKETKSYDGSSMCLRGFTAALGRLHAAFRVFVRPPELKEWSQGRVAACRAAKQFLQQLVEDRQGYLFPDEIGQWVEERYKVLREIAAAYDPVFNFSSQRQIIHGDLHPGNIGFSRDGVVFFDLDSALENYTTPLVDLAKSLVRLIMMGAFSEKAPDEMRTCLRIYAANLPSAKHLAERIPKVWQNIAYDNIARGLYNLRMGVAYAPLREFEKQLKYAGMTKQIQTMCEDFT